MRITKLSANGHEGLRMHLRELQRSNKLYDGLYILFKGAIMPETGKNWCSDCEKAKPIIDQALHEIANNEDKERNQINEIVFIECDVGSKEMYALGGA